MATLRIPRDAIVVLVGAPGCGKSAFARRHFHLPDIVSSDHYREVLTDDAASREVDLQAFALVKGVAWFRAVRGLLTVLDTTGREDFRRWVVDLAERFQRPAMVIVLDYPEAVCQAQNRGRRRHVEPEVVHEMVLATHAAAASVDGEGFSQVAVFTDPAQVRGLHIRRVAPSRPPGAPPAPGLDVVVSEPATSPRGTPGVEAA